MNGVDGVLVLLRFSATTCRHHHHLLTPQNSCKCHVSITRSTKSAVSRQIISATSSPSKSHYSDEQTGFITKRMENCLSAFQLFQGYAHYTLNLSQSTHDHDHENAATGHRHYALRSSQHVHFRSQIQVRSCRPNRSSRLRCT